jgi:uncharacterized membrane protein
MPQTDVAIAAIPTSLRSSTARLEAVDLVRGLLMLFMALDHTRDYFSNIFIDPTNPLQSWPALFATRWVTHLCAPGFVALCGTSVYLQRQRGKSAQQVSRLLATRGLWLMFLDVTLIDFGWSFTLLYPFLNIIFTIGCCMLGLAALQRLSTRTIGTVGAVILLLHNLLDPIHASGLGRFGDLWMFLHERNFMTLHGHPVAFLYFPTLAWFGIICVGYAFGPIVTAPYRMRCRLTLALGGSFLLIFAVLRVVKGYGDSYRFAHLGTPARTVMSFFQVQKYPPSLHYALATFGVLLLLYSIFDASAEHNWVPRVRAFVETFGRVPFLFYVLHIYLLHTCALLGTLAVHGDWRFWIGPGFTWGVGSNAGWGYGLAVVYAVWMAAVLTLYLPCLWFSRLKARRRDWWLSYL